MGRLGFVPTNFGRKVVFGGKSALYYYYVDHFYNTNCLELKLLVTIKFKTVPPGLCPEASLNYDEGKLTRELALCAIRCGDPKKDSDFIK